MLRRRTGLPRANAWPRTPISPEAKQNYLRIAAHWCTLAEHYDHIERTEAFLGTLPD